MANFSNHSPQGGGGAPTATKNSFKKGLGFFPNSMGVSLNNPISTLIRSAPPIPRGIWAQPQKLSRLYQAETTVSLFDIEQIHQSEGQEREKQIQAFGLALINEGFIGIKALNLYNLIETVYKEMNRYFHQPYETKLLDWRTATGRKGYSPNRTEFGTKALRGDFKESFFVTSDFSEWSQASRGLNTHVSEYFSILTEVNRYLMMFLAEFLGKEIPINTTDSRLRLAYYPPFKPGDDPKNVWVAPHKDPNTLTILSKGTVPGLEVYSNKKFWKPVIVPDRYLIITPGLLLQEKTEGMIKARWHRVINPGANFTRRERLSTVFYS